MPDVAIVAARRTPIGRFQGALAPLSAVDLGAAAIRAACADLDPARIDDVFMGHVLRAGCGQNTARQAAMAAGLPESVPATAIDKVCGSGLASVHAAVQAIRSGDATTIVAGGMESMSQAAYVLPKARAGLRLGHTELVDSMVSDGLWDAFNDYHMGVTAENLARRYAIDRTAQDAFAAESHRRAAAAVGAGAFDAELAAIDVPQRRGDSVVVERDEQPRADTTTESLARLKPAFDRDGTVTAGNASALNDGAAALVLMDAEVARIEGYPILARVAELASVGVDPAYMGIGPVHAVRRCLDRAGWSLADVDLIEANEAFAAQALAVGGELGWDTGRVNVNGGAIALGHPIGASGARVLVTLVHAMAAQDARRGIATLCIGGGQGIAIAIER
ncbi:acetyl-CoA C-acetyltransferase [Salinisphaera hydrothermalis]|uniref:Acetyl-CoA acetyltransferase n=1 Tax=Salinisphaera hydrothermalis (strain C41B8) TaxID=1304275 RepID=A0A084IPD6_SALHC|nr:acetyl-CoA C-acetyltransferase [Salinisphaera hydrothermalis]KEZ78570.1 acetyl-CoA acetyltransferase [Salinisphaera hydrothermalis C41B8]